MTELKTLKDIFKDYYRDYDRKWKCIWEGYVYMISCPQWMTDILPPSFFKIGKTKWINRNGYMIIKKRKFEKRFPEIKQIEKSIEIYDKSNEGYFK